MAMEGGSNSSWTVTRSTVLTKSETPIPTPGPSQVLVRVNAVSLNHRDHTVLHHTYPLPTKANLVPCSDGAGTVVGAGPGSSWATRSGEVVILHPNTWLEGDLRNFDVESVLGGGDAHGTLTEHIVLDDVQIQEAPTNLTVEEASTLPTAALTAWNALFMGPIPCGPGISILTQGTGGVSSFAIQVWMELPLVLLIPLFYVVLHIIMKGRPLTMCCSEIASCRCGSHRDRNVLL